MEACDTLLGVQPHLQNVDAFIIVEHGPALELGGMKELRDGAHGRGGKRDGIASLRLKNSRKNAITENARRFILNVRTEQFQEHITSHNA